MAMVGVPCSQMRKNYTVSLDSDIAEKAKVLAKRKRHSFSAFVELCLEEKLDRQVPSVGKIREDAVEKPL